MIESAFFQKLASQLEGELYYDQTMRLLYATDGSHYRELPCAVAIPKTESDIQKLISFAQHHKLGIIPRTAGTSLAGQVVGNGIVVDVSKYFNKILEINPEENYVRVQPGVVRDHLNHFLAPYGKFFGPETSTANRAMIGGMVGNNSCGAGSIVYGSTRDHLLEVRGFLSDGSEVIFKAISDKEFWEKTRLNTLEGKIYNFIANILSDPHHQKQIRENYPKPSIPRRNTGYALDLLLETSPFTQGKEPFNFCKLIAGSEGTLMFVTEIKLHINDLPPKHKCLICVHTHSVVEAMRANIVAVKYKPYASELIDSFILECSKVNKEQAQNRFFLQGEPGAVLVVEIACETEEERNQRRDALIAELQELHLGYAYPVLYGEDMNKVWSLRKAGLGLLGNLPGDAKPTELCEDTCVDVQDLPQYIEEFQAMLDKYHLQSVYYAHAGTGEIHIKPIINLKTSEGQRLFRKVAEETAKLVKKYNGSLSGEHGDGRLRGEFIPYMLGEHNYQLLKALKKTFDPYGIMNPGKIVDTPPMDKFLRHQPEHRVPEPTTIFHYPEGGGVLYLAEKCTGSADCRKTEITGGTMCPSYMATRNERETTRARANILREILTTSTKINRFDSQEIYQVMDLCLSCKGCKAECPSNVDIAKAKAEFLQGYYDANGVPLRTQLIANFSLLNKLASFTPQLYNFIVTNSFTSSIFKSITGFAEQRSLPTMYKTTLKNWYKKRKSNIYTTTKGKVYLFADEFTNYNDTEIGIKAVELLEKLGYQVIIPHTLESGRTYLSKGLLRKAQSIAIRNVELMHGVIDEKTPLIGVEPSAILTWRDEYIDLMPNEEMRRKAKAIAQNVFLFEEFIAQEADKGNITKESFKARKQIIKLHGHCHQKALASLVPTKKALQLPEGYEVHLIRSGCCGMAGSFGYEAEHYEISMKIGELVLFPEIRKLNGSTIIAASGTSCRHQIKDGTHTRAFHPIEILWDALKN
ncbi:MAG: FAD-binding protein [Cytophagales bacterium]|nr:FAD-binding protein [Cytophagales bacterium]MDW8383969.1 FAD-linked oxidase C-terminal domain-containing protein [Flammeovirgaceae bacterium]